LTNTQSQLATAPRAVGDTRGVLHRRLRRFTVFSEMFSATHWLNYRILKHQIRVLATWQLEPRHTVQWELYIIYGYYRQ